MSTEAYKGVLSDYAFYVKDHIAVSSLDRDHYFSTENMIPNRGGVCRATSLPEQERAIRVEAGDVLISNIRPYFKKIWLAKELAGCSNDVLCIRAKSMCLPEFLFYYLSSDTFFDYVMAGAKGTKMPRGDKQQIMHFHVLIPNLDIQKQVISILSCIDEKIQINAQINRNLEQQAQALFNELLSSKCSANWVKDKAEQFFEINIGKTPPRKEHEWFSDNPSDVTWVSISDLGTCGVYILESSEYLTKEAVTKFNIKQVPADSILLSFKLTVGRVAIADSPLTTNEAIAHFKYDNPAVREYLYLYLKNYNYQTLGSTSSIATAVNSKMIKSLPFIMPDEETLQAFHNTCSPMFDSIRLIQHENHGLSTLRDTLLPKLMSGEIDVSEVEV